MPMRMRDEQKDKALHVSCEGWTGVAFGVALFADVCTDVAALAIQKEGGEAALRLFDPYAPAEDVFAGGRSKDARIALYSNHYQHGLNQQKTTAQPCSAAGGRGAVHRPRPSLRAVAGRQIGQGKEDRRGAGSSALFLVRNSAFIILTIVQPCFRDNGNHGRQKLSKTRGFRIRASSFPRLLTEGLQVRVLPEEPRRSHDVQPAFLCAGNG